MGSEGALRVEDNFLLNFIKLYIFFLRLSRQFLKKITFDSRITVVYDTGGYSKEHLREGGGVGGE